jgi:uncharacterized protein
MTTDLEIAQNFFAAIEAGDISALEALYAPDASIWHNTDGQSQSVSENLKVLRWMVRSTVSRTYRLARRVSIPGGFLQQHVLIVESRQGRYEMPACIVVEVRDGRIQRLEEYLDSAHVAEMRSILGI